MELFRSEALGTTTSRCLQCIIW